MQNEVSNKPETERKTVASPPVKPQRISSDKLLAGARELSIEHGGEEYRLKITRNNKLILTK